MSRFYLVRHGQAPFGTDDYDGLTATGIARCEQLARHWHAVRLKLAFYNTGVSCLLWDGEAITIESMNAVSHLDNPICTGMITHC
jgi:hypothetical protein